MIPVINSLWEHARWVVANSGSAVSGRAVSGSAVSGDTAEGSLPGAADDPHRSMRKVH